MEDLAIKILNQKVSEKISFINRQATRNFDKNIDYLSISLSEKQFYVICKYFNIHKVYALGGLQFVGKENIVFDTYKCDKLRYNDRQNCYELLIKDIAYIEDEEERFNYIDLLYR